MEKFPPPIKLKSSISLGNGSDNRRLTMMQCSIVVEQTWNTSILASAILVTAQACIGGRKLLFPLEGENHG